MNNLKLADLLSQRAELEKQIADARRVEHTQAVAEIRGLMAQYGLTLADLSARSGATKSGAMPGTGAKVAPKYRDPATGATWTGRGLKPKWLTAALAAGREIGDFAL